MNELIQQSVELLRQMVRIPSESFSEQEVSDLIVSRLRSWGVECRQIGRNILASNKNFDRKLPTLALDAHIDTVPASSGYTRDPLDPGNDPSVVNGLGSNDDGASVVSLIAAFRHFYDRQLPVNLMLVLSPEEERSGPDGARFIYSADGPEEVKTVKWVIIGEPTQMKAAICERGLLVLDGEAKGVSGHAARKEGINALYIALDDITALRTHKFSRISPLMGEVGLNVTQISAGYAHNVVPDSCKFVVDIRPTEQYTNEDILEELQAFCKSTLVPRSLKNLSSATFDGSQLKATADRLGIETFSSPTASNWRAIGRDGIKMGPGDSARSHHADEYVLVSEIEEGVEKYIKFIESFYGNIME